MEFTHHIFLSYSRRDTKMMRRVQTTLENFGFLVWTDDNLTAGTPSWKNAIESAISAAGCLVVLLSPASKSSVWVERELDYATAQGKRVFPILVDGDEITAVPFELISTQYVDVRTDYDRALEALAQSVGHHLDIRPDADVSAIARQHDLPARDEIIVLEENTLTIEERIDHMLRLIWWYFARPRAFAKFRGLIDASVFAQINALVISVILLVVLFLPQFIAFPGSLSHIDDGIFIAIAFLTILYPIYLRRIGEKQWTILGFLWQIVKRLALLVLMWMSLFIIDFVLNLSLGTIYGTDVSSYIDPYANARLAIAGSIIIFTLLILIASMLCFLISLTGRFESTILMISIVVLVNLPIFLVVLASSGWSSSADESYGRFLTFQFFGSIPIIFVGILMHFLLKAFVRRYRVLEVARLIAMFISASLTTILTMMMCGLSVYVEASYLNQGDPFAQFQVQLNYSIVPSLLLAAFLFSLLFGWLMFGFGSTFSLRFRDAHTLGFIAFILLSVVGAVCVAVSTVLLSDRFFYNTPVLDTKVVAYAISVLFMLPVIIAMFMAATLGGALRGFNILWEFAALVFGTMIVATLLHMNGYVLGSRIRGLAMVALLCVILIYVYRNKVGTLKIVQIAITMGVAFAVLSTNVLFFSEPVFLTPTNTMSLVLGTLLCVVTIFSGHWVGKATLSKPMFNDLLNGTLVVLLVLLPILYVLNV